MAYESSDLRKAYFTPICVLFLGFYAFFPRYDGMLISNNLMLMQHIKDDPVAPSERTGLAIPPELDALILACLSKDPAERPQTGDELRAALEAIPLAESWTRERARGWWDTQHPA